MKTPKLLVSGKFLPEDLIVSVSESNRKIDSAIESGVDELWKEIIKKAKSERRTCYNGTTYRLNSLEKEENKLIIDFGTIEFKTREALTATPEYFDLSEEYYKKSCYNDATVKTSDDRYLMVELSGKSMNPNKTDLMGGIMEKPLEIETGDDVFKSIYIELEEEGCITKLDIKEIYLRAIYLSAKTDIGFYFEVTLNVSLEELQNRFELENKDPDIKSLMGFTRNEYLSHLSNHGSMTKQFIAKLI